MSMTLIAAIRKLGWPDRNGRLNYGNAAILCYLSSHNVPQKRYEGIESFVRKYENISIKDIRNLYA